MKRSFRINRRSVTEPISHANDAVSPKKASSSRKVSIKQEIDIKTEDTIQAPEEQPSTPSRQKKAKRKHVEITPDDAIKPDPASETAVKIEPGSSELVEVKKFDDLAQLPGTPLGWHSIFHRIEEQRKTIVAAVDMYGAEVLSDKEKLEPKVSRYHTLLALMLSSQTRDEITHKAMMQLKQHGLTVENILNTPEADLAKLIYPVGFYNNKAKNILKATQMLKDKYDGDIPPTLEGLLELPGVGPKMAHLVMLIAWDKATGIGVDTHVHRISNRLGWVKTDLPEKTRVALEKWLPEEYWLSINKLFVGFGQAVCLPVNPKCDECSVNDSCPSAFKETTRGKGGEPKLKRRKTM